MTALQLSGVSVPFGGAPGLEAVSLSVERGERLAIVGASGAGKTTLLRAIAGLATVSAGRVLIGGRDVTSSAPERRDAVYLHQTPTLFPHLDVFENVAFPLRVRRVPEPEVRERVRAVLESVALQELGRRAPSTLSGGQRHRVALARAIAARPAVLLLDEPLSSLDPTLRDDVRQAIITLQERDRPALVLVTHDIDEAGLLADRVGVLVGGRIAQIARPAELFARPASLEIARFLGFPNRVDGVVDDDGSFTSPLGRLDGDPSRPPGPAAAVFQPESVRVGPAGAAGRVLSLRHRLRSTTAMVTVGETVIEVADPERALAPGDEVGLSLDPARTMVFALGGMRYEV